MMVTTLHFVASFWYQLFAENEAKRYEHVL